LYTKNKDHKIEIACLKTIAAFLNSKGGALIVGVNDSGESLGLDNDKFDNLDKFYSHAMNLIRDRMGTQNALYIHTQFKEYQGKEVFAVKCKPSLKPVCVKDDNGERFFVRTGNSTTELNGRELEDYINLRFRR
jgi:predicted HTH transcriptional regulator